jgi:hypothetical protein
VPFAAPGHVQQLPCRPSPSAFQVATAVRRMRSAWHCEIDAECADHPVDLAPSGMVRFSHSLAHPAAADDRDSERELRHICPVSVARGFVHICAGSVLVFIVQQHEQQIVLQDCFAIIAGGMKHSLRIGMTCWGHHGSPAVWASAQPSATERSKWLTQSSRAASKPVAASSMVARNLRHTLLQVYSCAAE